MQRQVGARRKAARIRSQEGHLRTHRFARMTAPLTPKGMHPRGVVPEDRRHRDRVLHHVIHKRIQDAIGQAINDGRDIRQLCAVPQTLTWSPTVQPC